MPVPAGWVPTTPSSGIIMTLQPGAGAVAQTIFTPVGQHAGDVVSVTTEVDDECRALYLGRIGFAATSAQVVLRVTTALTGECSAEVAILKGTPTPGIGSSLALCKAVDTTAAFGSTGVKSITVSGLSGVSAGDHLWLAWWQKWGEGTPADFRAYLPDNIVSGASVYRSAEQPSSMTGNPAFTVQPFNVEGVWSLVGFS